MAPYLPNVDEELFFIMNEGWIKLYRKSKDHPLMRDLTAWGIFSWILLTVDRGTGEMTLGRFWASEYFKMNPSTFYKALRRLEKKYKVVTLTSNNKYTTVKLLNWTKYQSGKETVTQAGNNKVTTDSQQSNNKVTHIQEVKNRELIIEKDSSENYLLNVPSNDLAEFSIAFICTDRQIINKAQSLYDYCQSSGKSYKDYKAFLRNALRKDFGDRIEVQPFSPDMPDHMSGEGFERYKEMKDKILGKKFSMN